MTAPLVTTVPLVLVLGEHEAAKHEALQYGLDLDDTDTQPEFLMVMPSPSIIHGYDFPVDTPWVTAGNYNYFAFVAMREKFGQPKNWSDALNMQNTCVAIDPKKLRD